MGAISPRHIIPGVARIRLIKRPDGSPPEAAVETSNHLYEAAAVAKGQQILQDNDAALLKRRRYESEEA